MVTVIRVVHGPSRLAEKPPPGELEANVIATGAGLGPFSETVTGAEGRPATAAGGSPEKARASAGTGAGLGRASAPGQRTFPSKPAEGNCTSATPPPVNPGPPHRAIAATWLRGPATQLGSAAKAAVSAVMVRQSPATEYTPTAAAPEAVRAAACPWMAATLSRGSERQLLAPSTSSHQTLLTGVVVEPGGASPAATKPATAVV